MKLSTRLISLFVLIFLLLLLAVMPMQLAFSLAGNGSLSAREVTGSVWSGRLHGIQAAGMAIGDAKAGLRIAPLFLGRAEFEVDADAANAAPLSASFISGFGDNGVTIATGSVTAGNGIAALPIEKIEFQNFAATFSNQSCQTADGNVRIFVRKNLLPKLNLKNGLLGKARCSGKDLLLPLASTSTMEKLDIQIRADRSYQATFTILSDDPELAILLPIAGFRRIDDGFRLRQTGRF